MFKKKDIVKFVIPIVIVYLIFFASIFYGIHKAEKEIKDNGGVAKTLGNFVKEFKEASN